MKHKIKTVYAVHHSHTDIGYTDLQERIIDVQVDYIRTVLEEMKKPENAGFRWNCETLFCVEQFLKTASPEETQQFFELAATGKIGISATYLNFTDLADTPILRKRLGEWMQVFQSRGAAFNTAMFADINGISMGQRDALLDNGVEFLYTNIHCHHGMYPLYQNQNAYWWESASGKRLLVWNGEHYHLGNQLGIRPNCEVCTATQESVNELSKNLDEYLTLCEANGYSYDFIPISVSGVYTDNAPPEPEILRVISKFNETNGDEVHIEMVSLQELYAAIRGKLENCPVYRGDLNDWWANGVGSTPYAVKHYRDAQHRYALCQRLDPDVDSADPELARIVQDNLLLYAEHTWGHSATITNPYNTMVLNLDLRKTSYASKAHEAASYMLDHIARRKGDILRYYNTKGTIQVVNPSKTAGTLPVEFYIASSQLPNAQVICKDGRVLPCQISPHPRGKKVTFTDTFAPYETKQYRYEVLPAVIEKENSRKCYVGSEHVRDIVNDYDTLTYNLPYEYGNKWFHLIYRPWEGITSFVDNRTGREMLSKDEVPFFTPVYECTALEFDSQPRGGKRAQQERRLIGRNIRGKQAKVFPGVLHEIICREHGPVFTELELRYDLEGTTHCSVFLKLYEDLPRIDFRLELGKSMSEDIESVYLPMTLEFPDRQVWVRKGSEAFRPGIDQIPGTCMEYTMSDDGLAFLSPEGGALIASRDVPLFYFGELRHHPICLCDNKDENNNRPVWSWVMNNTWETNFKMDLSGFAEFSYTLWLTEETDSERAMDSLCEQTFDPVVYFLS